ncbi:hypothetical protein B0G84_6599 [Paraburkholderia sp. BL8N3]|nr:hypothetical protein B0G84_6599 [Paraburkholderia sp. BL8N3]
MLEYYSRKSELQSLSKGRKKRRPEATHRRGQENKRDNQWTTGRHGEPESITEMKTA